MRVPVQRLRPERQIGDRTAAQQQIVSKYRRKKARRQTNSVCLEDILCGKCRYFQKGSLIVVDGRLQSRTYQDKTGANRTAVEVVANNINFAGPKNSNGSNQGGSSYSNAAPSYQNAAPARPAAVEAAPSYSAGNADDFAVIDDSDDLPF